MAQLTRDAFVTELKSRGWSRFSDASLQRYLDWGLQDVYRLGKFEAIKDLSQNGNYNAGICIIPFATIAGVAQNIHAINAIDYQESSFESPLVHLQVASKANFWETIYPNYIGPASQAATGSAELYYVYGESIYIWPIPVYTWYWYVHYTGRGDSFSSGSSLSGLPERMDSAVLAAAEAQCCKRARDYEGYAVARASLGEMIDLEIANEKRQFVEEDTRIGRYIH